MIPLQMTDAALNMSPMSGKPGKGQRDGDGAFAEMFDLPQPADDSPIAVSDETMTEALLTTDAEVENAEDAVPIIVESDDVPFAMTAPLAVADASSKDGEIIALAPPKKITQQLQVADDGESLPARAAPKGSLAQSMVEGRFPATGPASDGAATGTSAISNVEAKDKSAAMPAIPVLREKAGTPVTVVAEQGRVVSAATDTGATAGASVSLAAHEASRVLAPISKPGFGFHLNAEEEPRSIPTGRGESATSTVPTRPTPAAEINAIPSAVATAAAAAKPDLIDPGKSQFTNAEALDELIPGLSAVERAGGGTPQATVTAAPATAGIETARHVAGQISIAVTGPGGRATEISLSPEELGRVRLHMTAVDHTITLHVMAERPETTDLLRRHIDVLAQEFRELGYENIAFSFGDGTSADTSDTEEDGNHDRPLTAIHLPEQDIKMIQETGPQTGLDLRL